MCRTFSARTDSDDIWTQLTHEIVVGNFAPSYHMPAGYIWFDKESGVLSTELSSMYPVVLQDFAQNRYVWILTVAFKNMQYKIHKN